MVQSFKSRCCIRKLNVLFTVQYFWSTFEHVRESLWVTFHASSYMNNLQMSFSKLFVCFSTWVINWHYFDAIIFARAERDICHDLFKKSETKKVISIAGKVIFHTLAPYLKIHGTIFHRALQVKKLKWKEALSKIYHCDKHQSNKEFTSKKESLK